MEHHYNKGMTHRRKRITTLGALPKFVLSHMLFFCDDQTLVVVHRVNKAWKALLTPRFWEMRVLRQWPNHLVKRPPPGKSWMWLSFSRSRNPVNSVTKLAEGPGVLTHETDSGRGPYQYEGDWLRGHRHGMGYAFWSWGSMIRYLGEWNTDSMDGLGMVVYPNERVYKGALSNNNLHGFGRMQWPGGDCYSGEFNCGWREGEGSYEWASGSFYVGTWERDLIHGHGSFYYDSHVTYKGPWRNHQRHGRAVLYYPDGDRYEGEWYNSARRGQGQLVMGSRGNEVVPQVWRVMDESEGVLYSQTYPRKWPESAHVPSWATNEPVMVAEGDEVAPECRVPPTMDAPQQWSAFFDDFPLADDAFERHRVRLMQPHPGVSHG